MECRIILGSDAVQEGDKKERVYMGACWNGLWQLEFLASGWGKSVVD